MAMLAEPRQRKRYNLVPRGKALYEDDSRFGTKMLEKMGWSKGKGLGATENGSKDFVRVRYKNDANGFGYEERDDQWTQHEQSFDGLLQSLNGSEESGEDSNKNTEVDDESSNSKMGFGFQQSEPKKTKQKLKDKISGESLEEKSKNSKARVHYKKFTKGKDLAQYSEKDLANIFGKKSVEENVNGIYEQFTAITIPQGDKCDYKEQESGVQMINSGISVNDYFKQKMEAMKHKRTQQIVTEATVGVEDDTPKTSLEGEPEKKKKKKQKRTLVDEPITEIAELSENAPKKKKKKTSLESIDQGITENKTDLNSASDVLTAEYAASAKNKKVKKSKKSKPTDVTIVEQVIEAEETYETAPKKKKKKDKGNRTNEQTLPEIVIEEKNLKEPSQNANSVELSKKSKNEKSNEIVSTIASNATSFNVSIDTENIDSKITKKKSNKKVKDVSENTDTTHINNLEDLMSKLNSYNLYTISSFCAEKFRNADLERFAGANLSQIVGYSLCDELKLDIRAIKNDEQRINQLWNCVLNKYDNAAPKNPYFNYKNKVHAARRAKQKIPRLHVKSLKRKHAFSGI